MPESFLIALALGLVSGLKHALEPDHVIAISTLMHRSKRWGRIARMGALWGAGHTTTLVLGVAVIGGLKMQVSEATLSYFELPVAAMLVGLGVWALVLTVRRARALRRHTHDGVPHAHVGAHPHPHDLPDADDHDEAAGEPWRAGWPSFAVGLVHGLAGSGALLLLVAATLPTLGQGILYALVYGLGSVAGMAGVALALALPLRAAASRPTIYHGLTGLSGVLSIALGVTIVWGFVG
jgi:ABC-type nickel/cobalt efflux system permease component RcnA